MTVTEKVSYLKGLAEGLGIDENEKNGKVIKAIIDVLDDLAFTVADLEDGFDELIEQVDAIDEDLGSLEDDFYEDEDEDDEDYDADWFEVEFPTCEEPLVIDDKALADGMIQCPNCHDKFALDLSDDTVEADDEE